MRSVAIITARGGSKRIPRKNIKKFCGRPIISYSIRAALDSGLFAEVMVSTDDDEIAEVAQSYGASVPFRRSAVNSDDFATTADVLIEVLNQYRDRGDSFGLACCCYPTAPFITPRHLCEAFELLTSCDSGMVMPVVKYSQPIFRSFKVEEGFLQFNWPEFAKCRSQDLPDSFWDPGQFYFFKVREFLDAGSLYNLRSVGMEVSEKEVQDIDTEEDWDEAELKYSRIHRDGSP